MDSGVKQIYQQLNQFIEQGQPVATATIVQVRGSAPRQVGSKMLIHPEGRHMGTIGGGGGEAAAIETGLQVIETGIPQTLTLDLTGSPGESDAQGVCGGLTRVFVERWSAPDTIAPRLLTAMQQKKPVALITVITAPETVSAVVGQRALFVAGETPLSGLDAGPWAEALQADVGAAAYDGQSKLLIYAEGALSIFVETPQPPPSLLIVGAGHVAQPLAQLGAMLGFEVTVLDDRPGFATPERFPTAVQTIVADFVNTLRDWPFDDNTFVVLVTRGHTFDAVCLKIILPALVRYIGMIGSKRRIRAVFSLLEQDGDISPEAFERVHAPIGLDIGAETPAEIAIGIVAEIVNLYRAGRAEPLSAALRRDARLPLHPGRN